MEHELLIKQIEEYCSDTNQSPSTFCARVANNASLYKRLKSGRGCGVKVLDRVRLYIANNPPQKTKVKQ